MINCIVLLVYVVALATADLNDDYALCRRTQDFGNSSLICDVDGLLSEKTKTGLQKELLDTQTRLRCQCPDLQLCYRNPGNGVSTAYLVVLIATKSDKVSNLNLNETTRRIYYDAKLGRPGCDNGMLVIYVKDTKQIATYRGERTYGYLTETEMAALKQKALDDGNNDDDTALATLFSGYRKELDVVSDKDAVSWSIVGMSAGVILAVFAIVLLLGLLCVGLCVFSGFCSDKKGDKEELYLSTAGSYHAKGSKQGTPVGNGTMRSNVTGGGGRPMEPVFVVTDPSELSRGGGGMDYDINNGEAIYSTPHPGTPPVVVSRPVGRPPGGPERVSMRSSSTSRESRGAEVSQSIEFQRKQPPVLDFVDPQRPREVQTVKENITCTKAGDGCALGREECVVDVHEHSSPADVQQKLSNGKKTHAAAKTK